MEIKAMTKEEILTLAESAGIQIFQVFADTFQVDLDCRERVFDFVRESAG